MSTTKYEYLRNVCKGRTDWKIKVRVIREWRGKTATGELFTSYNLLLLDAKNSRMQGFVPTFLADKLQRMLQLGKMYVISCFQVKDFTPEDKWRSVNMDRQIQFTNQTKAREISENEYFIPNNVFDFYAFEEVGNLTTQNLYLADVVGVVIKRENLKPVHTSRGKDQMQVKLKITDGKSRMSVTLWDNMAEDFQNEIDTVKYEYPLIIIIASGKISKWKGEVDICNFSPTTYYINYNHHSVSHLRKIIPNFPEEKETTKCKRPLQIFSVAEIKKFTAAYINEQVVCQVTINKVEEIPKWYYCVCTSCYKQVQCVEQIFYCQKCQRVVPDPDKKFGICVVASDETGDMGIVLMDRPIRILFGKRVYELEKEYKGAFPQLLKQMENGQYTIKVIIAEENIDKTDEMYLANDIFQGFQFEQELTEEETIIKLTEHSLGEPSGSSYHLDNISQLKDETEEFHK